MTEKPDRLFKKLTPENWLKWDSTSSHIVKIRDGVAESISGDDWADIYLNRPLDKTVPNDIHDLLDVARGTLCYGYFFYPLYTLGNEQTFRVQEAALRHKCAQSDAPDKISTFYKMVNWLHENGQINDTRKVQWHAARNLRNRSSHTDQQSIYDPTMAARGLEVAIDLINDLFANH
jgi:hypothetical protein